MHPKNYMQSEKGKFFDWIEGYRPRHDSVARGALKRQSRRALRRDAKRVIDREYREAA